MWVEMDVYCLDIGAHSVKVVILLESGEIKIGDELKARSIVDVRVGENNETNIIANSDFIPMINMSLQAILKSTMKATNLTTDSDNYLKTIDTNLYFDELLALLFEKIKSKHTNKNTIKTIATNLPQSETLNCATILSGLKHQTIPEHIAIVNAYSSTQPKNASIKKRVLAIDLGYSCMKLYNINIDDKQVDYKMKTYSCSNHEFTLALFNYAMDKGKHCKATDLLEECEVAKAKFANCEVYNFKVNDASVSKGDFEKCVKPIVQKLISKLREFLDGDLNWHDDVVLIGGSFGIPLVYSAVKRVFKDAVFVDIGVDPEYVIAYGMAVHVKKRSATKS